MNLFESIDEVEREMFSAPVKFTGVMVLPEGAFFPNGTVKHLDDDGVFHELTVDEQRSRWKLAAGRFRKMEGI